MELRSFESKILYFNGMYKLPVAPYPTTYKVAEDEMQNRPIEGEVGQTVRGKDYVIQRIVGFIKTLEGELAESIDIIERMRTGVTKVTVAGNEVITTYSEMDFLVDMADWLGDMIVYCASEMAKYGIPQKETLDEIMKSNFSKLNLDGSVNYDATGKVLKGPAYFKPEPQIRLVLEGIVARANKAGQTMIKESDKDGTSS